MHNSDTMENSKEEKVFGVGGLRSSGNRKVLGQLNQNFSAVQGKIKTVSKPKVSGKVGVHKVIKRKVIERLEENKENGPISGQEIPLESGTTEEYSDDEIVILHEHVTFRVNNVPLKKTKLSENKESNFGCNRNPNGGQIISGVSGVISVSSPLQRKRELKLTQKKKLNQLLAQIECLFQGQAPPSSAGRSFEMNKKFALCPPIEVYKMDLLRNELNKENRYNLTDSFPKDIVEKRNGVVRSIMSFAKAKSYELESLHMSIYFLDSYLLKIDAALRLGVNWAILKFTTILLATKLTGDHAYNDYMDFFGSEYMETRMLQAARMEIKIMRALNCFLSPPTVCLFQDFVISQMDFPTPLTEWLISATCSEVLKESLLHNKLINVPASKKSKFALQVCTKYFMKNFDSFNHLSWDVEKNRPIDPNDANYFATLKTLAMASCLNEFLAKFKKGKANKVIGSLKNLTSSPMKTRSSSKGAKNSIS